MPEYSSIKIRKRTKDSADKLQAKWSMNGLDFFDSMVEYFKKTGVNPRDQMILSPAEELKKFRDTIISFMRKQEADYIKPTFGKMETLIVRFLKYLDEEAPKKGGTSLSQNITSSYLNEDVKTSSEKENVKDNSFEKMELENKLRKEEAKLETTKKYFAELLNSLNEKTVGFDKKIVSNLPKNRIDEFKKYLKTL